MLAQLGKHLLKPAIFHFQLLELFYIRGFQTSISALPLVKGGAADLQLPADIFCLAPCFILLQSLHDLALCKACLFHTVCLKVKLFVYF